VEGTLDDVRELINGAELLRLWDQIYLPSWVRSAWRPLIDSAARQPSHMPLDPLQDRIARTALALPQARTLALAGGGAMIVHGFVTRPTKDVNHFTEIGDHEARQVVAALRRALEEQDLITHDVQESPLDHRFIAADPTTGAECTVEVFADGGRLRDRVTLDIGPMLHPDDLAADKVLPYGGEPVLAISST
jgi:hypothetical protein